MKTPMFVGRLGEVADSQGITDWYRDSAEGPLAQPRRLDIGALPRGCVKWQGGVRRGVAEMACPRCWSGLII